jgi:hypothetical protein
MIIIKFQNIKHADAKWHKNLASMNVLIGIFLIIANFEGGKGIIYSSEYHIL